MTAEISAIIVNYNAGSLLSHCVESLRNCQLEIEIIVVDNNSTDDSLAPLLVLPGVQVLKNAANLGFAAACNKGIQLASADYLLFINPDCTFQPGTLAELLRPLRDDPKVGMAGGLLINADGTEQAGARRAVPTPWRSFVRAFGLVRFADRWPRIFFDFHLNKYPLPEQPIEVEAISGACMLIKRQALAEVGEWDEGYFLHCEDLDLCLRFRQKDWKILFVPNAIISHAQGVCGKSRPVFVEWHKHKGMLRFYSKFFRHQYPGLLMWLVTLGVWLRFGLVISHQTVKRIGRGLGVTHG